MIDGKKWNSKEFSGTSFTPEQIEALKNGEEIEIQFTNKAGKEVKARGKLEAQTYKKRKFYGFKPEQYFNLDGTPIVDDTEYATGVWNGKNVKFKRVFSQHRFSDEEVERLLNGEEIECEFISKKGKPFKAKGRLQDQVFWAISFWIQDPRIRKETTSHKTKNKRKQKSLLRQAFRCFKQNNKDRKDLDNRNEDRKGASHSNKIAFIPTLEGING